MAIKIDFLADVAKFLRGTKDVGSALEDVADELDSLGGDRALGKLEDGMQDAGKEAKDLESKVTQAMRQMGQDAQQAGRRVGDSTTEGVREAGEGLDNLREESASTARESAASFDGSAESITGSFQEIAANAFVGFGPAGAAAGLALAVGMGIAISAMQKTAEEATAAKQKSVDMVDAIKEAGGNLADMDLSDQIISWGREVMEDNWVTLWSNEASTKFQETAKDAKEFGVNSRDAIRAAAGSADDSRKFLNETGDDWQRLTKVIEESRGVTEDGLVTSTEAGRAAQRQRDALADLRGQAEENIKTVENAVEIYGIETDAVGEGTAALEAKNAALEEQARALEEASGAALAGVGAEIAYNDAMAQGAKDIAANGKGLDLHTATGKANQQTLVDMAKASNDLRAAQINQGDSTDVVTAKTSEARESFVRAAIAAGYGAVEANQLANKYGLIPGNVDTHVKAHNVAKTKTELDGLGKPVHVPVKPYLEPGAKWSFHQELLNATKPVVQSVSIRTIKELGNSVP